MFRKLGIGFTALALLVPGLASALGVGDYSLKSYLNQPLNMEVELLDTGDLSPEEVIVSLASQQDFDSAGIDRLYFLSDLNFEVELKGDGTGVLHIRSAQPVREPYLNFLIELLWPTGRLLREYTVLLDPPSYQEEGAGAQVQAPPQQQVPAAQPGVSSRRPAQAPVQAPSRLAPSVDASRPAIEVTEREEYVVQATDTMWRIALNNRPAQSVSVQQMLLAIQALNEDAFIDGNVNLVREGTVLRMPTEDEIRNIRTRDALAEIAEQNREWRAKLEARGIRLPTRPQLDATARKQGSGTAGPAPDAGKVTLVAPDSGAGEGRAAGSGGTGADSRALENELAIRDENLDSLKRENNELADRLTDLKQQVETSEKLLQLRNDQIARLQEQLRQLQDGKGGADAPVVVDPVRPEMDVKPAPESEQPVPGAEQPKAEGEQTQADSPAAEGTLQDQAAPADGQAPASGQPPAVAEPAKPQAAPKPVVAPQPEAAFAEDSLPLMVAAAVALVLLLLGGGLVVARRRKEAARVADEEAYDEYDSGDDFLAPIESGPDDEDDDGSLLGDFEDADADVATSPADAGQDPLEEVDVYTAYGRHAEAVTFLKNEIHKAPGRSDLKVRLLEVLAETRDIDGFEREAAAYGNDSQVKKRIESLRAQLGLGAGAAAGAVARNDEEPSLDDLEFDLAADLEPSRPTGDGTIDFESASLGESEESDETLVLDGGDGLDLDLSLEDDESTGGAGMDELSLEDDSTLSLELEEDSEKDEFSLDIGGEEESVDELSAALDLDSALDLDDSGDAAEADVDFGDVSLADASEEFNEVAERPAAEDIDLSLDDLELDAGSDLSLEEPVSSLEAETEAELSLEGLEEDASDDFELSLEEDATTGADLPALGEVESAGTVQRPALEVAPTEARAAVTEAPDVSLGGDEDDFDFLGDTDENATKLDLAKAYIDMGDAEGARDILNEVLSEGNTQQQQEAKELLSQVG